MREESRRRSLDDLVGAREQIYEHIEARAINSPAPHSVAITPLLSMR